MNHSASCIQRSLKYKRRPASDPYLYAQDPHFITIKTVKNIAMRFSVVGMIAGVAALAQGQSLTDLPKCAQSCVGDSITTTGCSAIKVSCICASSDWIAGLSCCVAKNCTLEDQAKTIQFAQDICKSVGISVPTDAQAACASKSNSTSSANSTTSPTASAATTSVAPTKTGGAGFAQKEYLGAAIGLMGAGLFAAML